MDMTISQALRKISKIKGSLKEALERAAGAVTYVSDEPPAYKFSDMLGSADLLLDELVSLETRLRITNAQTTVSYKEKTITLAEATAVLQEMKGRIVWLKALNVLPQETKSNKDRVYDPVSAGYVIRERNQICEMPEAKRDALVTELQGRFDALNDAVETVNHQTTLKG